MAIVEICDICREEISKYNGITIVFSDMKGLGFRGDDPCIVQRNYKARILLNIARRMRGGNDKYKRNNTIVNETLL